MKKALFAKSTLSVCVGLACASYAGHSSAGEITGLVSTAGDGFVFVDEADGLPEPGIKIVTTNLNNDGGNNKDNCIMSSRDLGEVNDCADAPNKSGKRVKYRLTGTNALDSVFSTTASGGVSEYLNKGKLTNFTGARIVGYQMVLGTGTGDNFVAADDSALAGNLLVDITDAKATVPCGLFGSGCGGDPTVKGYFVENLGDPRSEFTVSAVGTDTLETSGLTEKYLEIIGNGLLSESQTPDGIFLDDNDPDTEDELVYWKAGDEWRDETNTAVSAADVDTALDDPTAYIAKVEDMANSNYDFFIDVADINSDFTIRWVPVFSPIVQAAGNDYQFAVASSLDSSEILFLDADPEFANVITEVTGLATQAEQQQALERIGTSYLRNFGTQTVLLVRNQVGQLLKRMSDSRFSAPNITAEENQVSLIDQMSQYSYASSDSSVQALAGLMESDSSTGTKVVNEQVSAFVTGSISTGDIDDSANGIDSDYDGFAITGGLEYQIDDVLKVGSALSYGETNADIGDSRGELDADGITAMIYGSYGGGLGAYADMVIGYSWLDYDNERDINFGTTSETAKSDSDGDQKSYTVNAGYNFEVGNFIAGPSVRYQYFDLEVDGYQESGAGVLSMSVDDMDYKSKTLWLGGEAMLPLTMDSGSSYQLSARLHMVKEFEDDATTANTSFTGGTLPFTTPIDAYDDSYVAAGVSIATDLKTKSMPLTLSVSYGGVFGNDDYSEHQGSLSIATYF